MILDADRISVCPRDDENLSSVWFYDSKQDYVLSLSRFVDEQDGTIEVMVRDQINQRAESLRVTLGIGDLHVELPPGLAAALDGNRDYTVRFSSNDERLRGIEDALRNIFGGRPGLTVERTASDPPR